MSDSQFQEHCIVELFGHQKIAGLVSSQEIGGESFVRVDVPEVDKTKPYTRFFGKGAIYSLTPTTEDLVKAFLRNTRPAPVERWYLEGYVQPDRAVLQSPCDQDDGEM